MLSKWYLIGIPCDLKCAKFQTSTYTSTFFHNADGSKFKKIKCKYIFKPSVFYIQSITLILQLEIALKFLAQQYYTINLSRLSTVKIIPNFLIYLKTRMQRTVLSRLRMDVYIPYTIYISLKTLEAQYFHYFDIFSVTTKCV